MVQNTAFGTDPTATPHPTHGQARPDNRRDTLNPLLLVQRHKPPPRQPRTIRHGLGPGHRRGPDERPSHPWKERSRSSHQEGRTRQHSPLGEEGRGHILRQKTLRTPLQRRPPPQALSRRRRYGPGPPPLPSGPFSGPRRHTDNRSQNLKRTPLQRLADSRQQGTPVQTHLRNRRRNLRGEEPGTKGGGGDSRKRTI